MACVHFLNKKKKKEQQLNSKTGLNRVMCLVGRANLAVMRVRVAHWPHKPFSSVTPKIKISALKK